MPSPSLRVAALLLALAPATARAQEALALPPLPGTEGVADCAAGTPPEVPCRLAGAPTAYDVERRLRRGPLALWTRRDTLTLAWRADGDDVTAVRELDGLRLPLARLGSTRFWVLQLRLPGAERAVVSVRLVVERGVAADTLAPFPFRADRAPREPRSVAMLAGALREDTLEAEVVTSYLPPPRPDGEAPAVIYVADGARVRALARVLDPLIERRVLPAVALVGVHATAGGTRAAHDAFVAAVPAWAERTLGVRADRDGRAAFGVADDVPLVLALARDHADRYAAIIAFSGDAGRDTLPPPAGWAALPRLYLAAGSLERRLASPLAAYDALLARQGVNHLVRLWPGGHDEVMWREEFLRAVGWWLGAAAD